MATLTIKTEPNEATSLHQICRLCLCNESLEEIFNEEYLHHWISEFLCVTITAEDRLSKAICVACRQKVSEFQNFRTRCREVQGVLESILKNEDDRTREANNQLVADSEVLFGNGLQLPEDRSTRLGEYRCVECNKIFRMKKYLHDHQRLHGPRTHFCTICEKAFKLRHHLKKHMTTHTHAKTVEIDTSRKDKSVNANHKRLDGPRKHICTICEKAFKLRHHLKDHIKTHTKPVKVIGTSQRTTSSDADHSLIRIEGKKERSMVSDFNAVELNISSGNHLYLTNASAQVLFSHMRVKSENEEASQSMIEMKNSICVEEIKIETYSDDENVEA